MIKPADLASDVWDTLSAAGAGDAARLKGFLERDPNLYRAGYWAARNDLPDMVEFLLSRGAPTRLPDDEAWATPLAWATRRGHAPIAGILRRAGATA